MNGPTTTFDFENTGKTPVTLILEPEACEFQLPPGEKVTVTIPAGSSEFFMTHSVGLSGEVMISFWPDYEIFYNGKDVWNCL